MFYLRRTRVLIVICISLILIKKFSSNIKKFKTLDRSHEINEKIYLKQNSNVKSILFWNSELLGAKINYRVSNFKNWNCEVTNCLVTNDRNEKNVELYDALLFHGINFKNTDLPPKRNPKQPYIFYENESPEHDYFRNTSDWCPKSFFNWTLTYRFDSNIHYKFGSVVDKDTFHFVAPSKTVKWMEHNPAIHKFINPWVFHIAKSKGKGAAWIVSHCNSSSMRDRLVEELGKDFEVDVFGRCQYNRV
jgi:alpha-1,3-fucosyltransferase